MFPTNVSQIIISSRRSIAFLSIKGAFMDDLDRTLKKAIKHVPGNMTINEYFSQLDFTS